MSKVAGIVLAAGKGTRMKSALPKALHTVCGLPMGEYVGRALIEAGVERPIFVIGASGDLLRAELGRKYDYAYQKQQKGTGDACKSAMTLLQDFQGPVLVAPADAPLVTGAALKKLLGEYDRTKADCVIAACRLDDPTGYGRVVTDGSGAAVGIVEEAEADEAQKAISLVGTSFYCFDSKALSELLAKLQDRNAKGEYYLTDLVGLIARAGGKNALCEFPDPSLLLGVNDRWQLAQAAQAMRKQILRRHALNGVTLADPHTIHIGAEVEIESETKIDAMTVIEGRTTIGEGCHIGPLTRIFDCDIGDEVVVTLSHMNGAIVGSGSRVGPYANLRPGTVLAERVKIGNFVEVKATEIGEGASLSHLAYAGDAKIGARANVGAGTITCNFDGFSKHETVIGEDSFVGSNSTLVAPVKIGDRAITAAGSTITEDVPDDALAIGRSRQENKEGWAKRWRQRKKEPKKKP